MSVRVEDNGRRSVQVEVEVAGSPEEVWKAIATGPGISSWFVPSEVEEREGGACKATFGPGMESVSTITHWDPPRSFKKDGEGMSEDAPPVATEWTVEARSGGKCVVRVVHSWFASTDDWDGQWESVEQGWKSLFAILQLKLEHFPGQPGTTFDASGIGNLSEADAWAALTGPLGMAGAGQDGEIRSGEDAPSLAGKVQIARPGEAMIRISEPGTGAVHLCAMSMGEQTYLSVRFYLFGETAAATAAEVTPQWTGWFAERFPMGG